MIKDDTKLIFKNQYGGYDEKNNEYQIILSGSDLTPSPWSNIIANPVFGTLVTESGASFTWYINSSLFRLTPCVNDSVTENSGELIYLRDEDTLEVWSPTPFPIRENEKYTIKHGFGYSIFEHSSHHVDQNLTISTDLHEPVKRIQLKLKNTSKKLKRMSATYYCQWLLGDFEERVKSCIWVNADSKNNTVLARNVFIGSPDFVNNTAFLTTPAKKTNICASRREFFGYDSNIHQTPAWLGTDLDKKKKQAKAPVNDPCGVIQVFVDIEPGQEESIVFFLGIAPTNGVNQAIRRLNSKSEGELGFTKHLDGIKKHWKELFSSIQVITPDKSLDVLMNGRLIYQSLSSRLWGRLGFYQPSGAYGIRDMIQDSLALIWSRPKLARNQLLLATSRQFISGEVQQWWHPPEGYGVKSLSSDTPLWLVYGIIRYIEVTGDVSILDEKKAYLQFNFNKYKDGAYFKPEIGKESVSVYEHCVKSVERVVSMVGSHGLPLILGGDWNDSLSNVGAAGKGESVWLGMFLSFVLKGFIEICKHKNDAERADRYQTILDEQIKSIEKHGWKDEWFVRAFDDNGNVLGAKESVGAKIDSIPQSWAAICGMINPKMTEIAVESAFHNLVSLSDNLVLLLDPPYVRTGQNVGYIRECPPGVRENGGFYNHAALWLVWATTLLGQGDRANQLLNMINPFARSENSGVNTYSVEPYALASDIYTKPPHVGRGGWTWYTGSSGLFYCVVLENILGLQLRKNALTINPCIPKNWPKFTIKFKFRRTFYILEVNNPNKVCKGVKNLSLDGKTVENQVILLLDDAKNHYLSVTLG